MKSDRLIVLATVLLAAIYWFATEQIKEPLIGDPIGPKAIPRLLIIGLLIAAALLWLETMAGAKASHKAVPSETSKQEGPAGAKGYIFIAAMILSTLGYFSVFNWLGYALATALYLYALMAIFNPGKTRANVLTAMGFSFGSYLAFTRLFGAQMPAGLLPF